MQKVDEMFVGSAWFTETLGGWR